MFVATMANNREGVEMVEMLLKDGRADPNRDTNLGRLADVAVKQKNFGVLKLLLADERIKYKKFSRKKIQDMINAEE